MCFSNYLWNRASFHVYSISLSTFMNCLLIPLFCFLSGWIFLVDFGSCFYILDIKPCYIYCIYFSVSFFNFVNLIYSFIWVCWVLFSSHRIFSCAMKILSCGMYDLVLWPGPLHWKLRVLSHCTTKEVPNFVNLLIHFLCVYFFLYSFFLR